MKKRKIVKGIIYAIIFYLFFFVPIPYYIERPGSAVEINPLIEVEGVVDPVDGRYMLTTVEMFQATPFTSFFQFLPFHSGVWESQLLGQIDDYEEYRTMQRYFMSNSIDMAKVAAFEEAGLSYDIDYQGVYVMSVSDESQFEDELSPGDSILELNGERFDNTQQFVDSVSGKNAGDTVSLLIERDGEELTVDGDLVLLESTGQPGIGITLVTRSQVETDPTVAINSGNIGGPSAGLMFALEVYTQITDLPLNNLQVAGTGTINEFGEVGRIGGVDKKVVAADREGADIFFVPDDPVDEETIALIPDYVSNYELALETAEAIDTEMEIVPVQHISDAISYLNLLVSN